jgi:hypothetical protein
MHPFEAKISGYKKFMAGRRAQDCTIITDSCD